MNTKNILCIAGILCVVAAIIGGGLDVTGLGGLGIKLPLLHSVRTQLLLAIFGVILLIGTFLESPRQRAIFAIMGLVVILVGCFIPLGAYDLAGTWEGTWTWILASSPST